MEIIVSPNSFKGSLTSIQVSKLIYEGLKVYNPNFKIKKLPIADGGDGSLDIFKLYLKYNSVKKTFLNPIGEKITTEYITIEDNKTAIIEFSNASGLILMNDKKKNHRKLSSFGTGQQIKSAIEMGVKNIIICLGGSATIDGGAGILRALGVKFFDIYSNEILDENPIIKMKNFDLSNFITLNKKINFHILVDVKNSLLGKFGAVKIFGKQKGLKEKDFNLFEKSMLEFSKLTDKKFLSKTSDIIGGAAAGGAAAFLKEFLNAKIYNGTEYILNKINYKSFLSRRFILITGEGRLDSQSLFGKAPISLTKFLKKENFFSIAIGGSVEHEKINKFLNHFDLVFSSCDSNNLDFCLKNAENNLFDLSKKIGKIINYLNLSK
tara:strand:- start:2232 stop:3368 length:1137 start_codon:yes stop_codon:yes gene_type:complete